MKRLGYGCVGSVFERNGKVKNTATAWFALNDEGSVHQFDKLLTDCEPQSRPSVFSCVRSICLDEGQEDPSTGLLRDADPRVEDGETHPDGMAVFSRNVE